MWWIDPLLAVTFLFGHLALWVVVFNRLHATPLSCRTINLLEKVIFAIILLPLLVGALQALAGEHPLPLRDGWSEHGWLCAYIGLCWLAGSWVALTWLGRMVLRREPAVFLANDTREVDLSQRLGRRPVLSRSARLLARVPGNEIWRLRIQRKRLALPRLPASLDGLSIVQLSDLHFAGHMEQEFFQEVIAEAMALQGDLIVITGDLVDKTRYIDWLDATVGRLSAPSGVYYVLGNHDLRVRSVEDLHSTLQRCGLIHVGGRTQSLSLRGEQILLAGNEAPWFPPPQLSAEPDQQHALRILLSHSPDQFSWARRHRFDLMLAGHTHGGQIRFPIVGPVVCPSRYGVRYASGVFHQPPTLLHVTRGIAGLEPIRLNCPPELNRLVLARG